jgi:hypothetical protein
VRFIYTVCWADAQAQKTTHHIVCDRDNENSSCQKAGADSLIILEHWKTNCLLSGSLVGRWAKTRRPYIISMRGKARRRIVSSERTTANRNIGQIFATTWALRFRRTLMDTMVIYFSCFPLVVALCLRATSIRGQINNFLRWKVQILVVTPDTPFYLADVADGRHAEQIRKCFLSWTTLKWFVGKFIFSWQLFAARMVSQ